MRRYFPMFIRHAIVGGFLGIIATLFVTEVEQKAWLILLFAGLASIAGSILELYFPVATGKLSLTDEETIE